eukprot:3026021-Pleurochrysis_carterae.AAC.12
MQPRRAPSVVRPTPPRCTALSGSHSMLHPSAVDDNFADSILHPSTSDDKFEDSMLHPSTAARSRDGGHGGAMAEQSEGALERTHAPTL